jgi:hypothetical protein
VLASSKQQSKVFIVILEGEECLGRKIYLSRC